MSDRVTIKSIARDLGISHMTVSRALSNHPKVRESTRNTVQDHARKLGYVKSAAATIMRGDRTRIIGLLLPNLVNEFYARYANSLSQDCEKNELQLIIHLTNDDIRKEQRAIFKLQELQASGVVMVPAPGTLATREGYLKGMKVIQLIRTRAEVSDSIAIRVDDAGGIIEAVSYLINRGHRRIAYIGGNSSLSSGYERLSAFKSGMLDANIEPVEELILTSTPSFEMGYQAAHQLLEKNDASSIICGGFEISNGALNGFLEKEVALPADLSFIGYGDPSYYRWLCGGISTIKIPVRSLASRTIETLVGKDDSSRSKPQPKGELIIRNSVSSAEKG